MMELQAIWLIVVHYGYAAVIEFAVDFGDQFATHYVMVLVLKAGVIHVGWITVKHIRKKRAAKK